MNIIDVDERMPLVSSHGIPASIRDSRKTCSKQLAVYFILASTVFERIAFYILAATLVLTAELSDCNSSNGHGTVATFTFIGISNISTLIFAVFTDAKIGRAKTILGGFFLYLLGYILAIVVKSPPIYNGVCNMSIENSTHDASSIFDEPCATWFLPTLMIIAIGAGAVQANMAVFGAEQIQESKITSRYFDKYVLAVNIGAILAKFAFNYTQSGDRNYIAYIYASSALIVAVLLFLIGHRYYIHVTPYDSVVTKCIPVTRNALQSWCQHQKDKRSKAKARTVSTSNSRHAARTIPDIEDSITRNERRLTFLDFAKAENHGKFLNRIVDDVKSLRGAFLVFPLLIPYWLIYDQLNSTFRLQAQHMQGTEVLPMVIVSLADPVILIVGILVLLIIQYKYLDARKQSLTIINKFVIGMCFGVITMCIAGTMEKFRQDKWHHGDPQSKWGIYNLIPQGLGMGVSELFVMVGSFEYAYFAAPRSAQTLFMSLRFSSIGISSFLGMGYMSLFTTKESTLDFGCSTVDDMKWRFSTYFFILAGVQFIFIIIFLVLQKKLQIIKLNRQQIEKDRFLRYSSNEFSARQ